MRNRRSGVLLPSANRLPRRLPAEAEPPLPDSDETPDDDATTLAVVALADEDAADTVGAEAASATAASVGLWSTESAAELPPVPPAFDAINLRACSTSSGVTPCVSRLVARLCREIRRRSVSDSPVFSFSMMTETRRWDAAAAG